MPREGNLQIWSNELEADPVRLVAFQRWLAAEIDARLKWPADQGRRFRQVGQAAKFIQVAVADLGKRGWLFRPAELARLITNQLDHVAAYQDGGAVRDIYKYLERAWHGWADRKAEELSEAARIQGVHRGHMERQLPPSLPEIVLKNLEAKDQAVRDKRLFRSQVSTVRKGRCNADAGPFLPGFGGR